MRVAFVLRSAEVFPVFLRFVLPFFNTLWFLGSGLLGSGFLGSEGLGSGFLGS